MAKKNLLSIIEIEDKVKTIIENLNRETFIVEFLELFDIPKASITRAKSKDGDFLIRNKVYYRKVKSNALHAIDEMDQEILPQNQKPRYLIATDFKMFYAKDTKTKDSLAITIEELPIFTEFFLAWNGIEKVNYQKENPADIKAAERFTKLYDELVKINPEIEKQEVDGKSFNLFLIRSLFLYFAEDTEIIRKGSFTNILKTRTETDGSNLNSVVKKLFAILDVPKNQRQETPEWLNKFPYVNGNLFKEPHRDLNFSTLTRQLLIDAGELLNWNEINPDILGAMIQTVANKEERKVSGMHYTSVPNILKVIKPLFLDNLQSEYQSLAKRADDYLEREISEKQKREQQRNIIKKLNKLLERISNIKFLDPACGSGNFLIITYKELRRLEIQILLKIREIQDALKEKNVYQGELLKESKIKLKQFSGIEFDDFAHEVAKLSLYIAEHQMNIEMMESLADYQPRILPLQESGNIVHGNALVLDWADVVKNVKSDEVYIMGNPPYVGSKRQNDSQKKDLSTLFIDVPKHKQLDYISGWFIKGTQFINQTNSKLAFVTTNSINQGQQVAVLWNEIFKFNVEIEFAYTSFKWGNNASNNARVTVAIIGISPVEKSEIKYLFDEKGNSRMVNKINAYLVDGENIIVSERNTPLSNIPEIVFGSMANDNGNLIINSDEYFEIINEYPYLKDIIKKFIGGKDFIDGNFRYALWMTDNEFDKYADNPIILKRIEANKKYRKNSKRKSTQELAKFPYRFGECRHEDKDYILIPRTSSESREYVPMGFFIDRSIASDSVMAVYDAPIWLLGILESRMHMTWLRAVGGRLKTDYRYSAGMVYNTFPIPQLSTNRKNMLEEAVLDMLDVREEEGGTLADLYGGANKPMNARLREAHDKIDGIVERAYKQEPFKSDEERLSILLKLYQEMVSEEKK